MTFLGFIVCVIVVGAYLAVCYEDSDKRKFEKRWDHIQKTGGFTNYNRDGSLKIIHARISMSICGRNMMK